jgi:hypothetical protein
MVAPRAARCKWQGIVNPTRRDFSYSVSTSAIRGPATARRRTHGRTGPCPSPVVVCGLWSRCESGHLLRRHRLGSTGKVRVGANWPGSGRRRDPTAPHSSKGPACRALTRSRGDALTRIVIALGRDTSVDFCLRGALRRTPHPSDVRPLPTHGRWSGQHPQVWRSLSRPQLSGPRVCASLP